MDSLPVMTTMQPISGANLTARFYSRWYMPAA
jgi:hypothetical protein